jgi:hypothetical protein
LKAVFFYIIGVAGIIFSCLILAIYYLDLTLLRFSLNNPLNKEHKTMHEIPHPLFPSRMIYSTNLTTK